MIFFFFTHHKNRASSEWKLPSRFNSTVNLGFIHSGSVCCSADVELMFNYNRFKWLLSAHYKCLGFYEGVYSDLSVVVSHAYENNTEYITFVFDLKTQWH